jgi:Mg-chelatase subunit ChlD
MEAQKGEGEPTEVQKAKSEPTEAQKGEGEPTEDQKAKGEPTEAQKGEGEPTEAQKGEGEDGAQGGSGSANGASAYTEALSDKDVRPVNLRPTDKSELKDRRGKGEQHASDMAAVIAAIRGADKSKGQAIPASTPSSTVLMTETMAAAAARSGRQRTLLARALKRNELDLFEGGLKHGKLDRRAFARLAAGAPNVFGRRELTEGYETDAVVLVDGSASMEGERINSASTMALVIAQAAAQVGVSCTTYLFGASHYHYRSANGLFEVNGGRQKPQASQFAGIPMMGGGGTPLSASMLAVALRQAMAAPYKRRVMFVVSDGMCDDGPESLKAVATYVETALGTELAHMSIHMRPQACFRNEVHVPRGSDIAAIGLETLTAKLAKGF